ncbi:MAG: MarR family transcriptional regulator [Actinobacteria bacterium]|nr:MarR family transcriptional regulator [Actinomycetota bacterium]
MRELALRVRDLMVAADRYRQALAATLRVGVPEAVALGHLFLAGQLTPTAIAERLGVTTASVTGLLDRLAASGYVVRSANPRDRRSVLVSLTDDGHRAIQASFDLFTADIGRAMAGTGPAERAGLERLLQRTAAVLQQRAADPDRFAELLAATQQSATETPESRDDSAP